MDKIQVVAIDDQTKVTMVTKCISDEIEFVFCRETGEGTIFFGEMEFECNYTETIDAAIAELKTASLFKTISTLQRIARHHLA